MFAQLTAALGIFTNKLLTNSNLLQFIKFAIYENFGFTNTNKIKLKVTKHELNNKLMESNSGKTGLRELS